MVSSPTVVSPPRNPLTSDADDDEYEIVYEEIEEEIEVEEEVEVEEEREEEDDAGAEHVKSGDDVEIEENLAATSPKNLKNDTGKVLELDEHKDNRQSSSLSGGVFVKNIGDAKTSESSEKEEELYINGEKISKYNKEKTLKKDIGEVNQAKTTPFIEDVNATSRMANSGENVSAIASIMAETNQSALEGVGNISPRLHAARKRSRDPIPSAEFEGESKKLRIVCEFHVKGWCIRGKSCRFLHIKDGPDAVMMKSEALGREATSSSACIPPLQNGKNPKLNSEMEKLVLPEDDTYLVAPTREDRWSFKHNLYLDNYRNYGSPPVRGILSARDSAYHGSSSIKSHDNDCDNRESCFGPTMDEIISKNTNIVQSDARFADLPDSYRHPLPFCSSSWNTSAHGPHKFSGSNLEHHAYASSAMQRSIPLASCSESDTLSRNHIFWEAEPAKFEATFSSFGWEPSALFIPSHEMTQTILLKECGYNPLLESIDKKDVKDVQMRFSHSDQGSSIKNVNVQKSSLQGEDKLLNYVLASDSVKDNTLSSSNDDKVKHVKTMDGNLLEVDRSGTKDDIDAELRDDHVQSESKAFKYLKSALIESVKELVKPYWREGFLSKDAHKLIVKKAVDKVLSTMPTHQIPSTPESVKSYISSSQPKLAKLVEGYLNIYGKT